MQKLNASPAQTVNERKVNLINIESSRIFREEMLSVFSLREIALKCDELISDLLAFEAETSGTVIPQAATFENIFFLRTLIGACNAMADAEGAETYVPGVDIMM